MTTDLIKKLEGLTGTTVEGREVDALIRASPWYAATPSHDPIWGHFVRALGGSVDAAIALAERVGWRVYTMDASIKGRWSWILISQQDHQYLDDEQRVVTGKIFTSGSHADKAIALCIAILKAKEAQDG